MSIKSWAMLLTLSGLWGASFFLGKVAIADFTVTQLVFFRVSLAAAALWVFLFATRTAFLLSWQWSGRFLLLGLMNNLLPFSLIFWGQQYIASGLASILNAFTPIFTMLILQVLTDDEKLTSTKLFAGALGITGVAVLIGEDALSGLEGRVLPQLAVLGAAFFYGLSGFYLRRFREIAPASVAAGQLTSSTILLLPLVLFTTPVHALLQIAGEIWLSVIVLALFCTAGAYLLFFRLYQLAGATNASMVTFLIPVSAILLGTIFLGERLEWNHWCGMALIVFALLLIDGRLTMSRKVEVTQT